MGIKFKKIDEYNYSFNDSVYKITRVRLDCEKIKDLSPMSPTLRHASMTAFFEFGYIANSIGFDVVGMFERGELDGDNLKNALKSILPALSEESGMPVTKVVPTLTDEANSSQAGDQSTKEKKPVAIQQKNGLSGQFSI